MQLLSIADLSRPQAELAPLIQEAQSLAQMYDDFITKDDETHTYETTDYSEASRSVGFHASSISGCFRRLVHEKWGTGKVPQTSKVNMKRRFRLGTAVHGMVQSDFRRMAAQSGGRLHFQDEARISPEHQEIARLWGISSSADGIFTFCRWYPEHGQWFAYLRVGLEIKTMSNDEFDKAKEPKDEHKDQTCVYMKCLDLPLMWTLYYNKSNSNLVPASAPWLFQFDPQRWANLELRMRKATEYVMQGQLPAKEESFSCTWCPYAWHCQPAILSKAAQYQTQKVSIPANLRRRS
jgi:hypothetical protein